MAAAFTLAMGGMGLASATTTYVYTDAAGSVLATTDAQGNVLQRNDYKPYGALASPAPTVDVAYTGHVLDPDTGLLYMKARYYDPVTTRFLSADGAQLQAGNLYGLNRYAYADGNPNRYKDPTGNDVCGVFACENYDSGYDDTSDAKGGEGSLGGGRYVIAFDGAGENLAGREGTENGSLDDFMQQEGGHVVDGGLVFSGTRGRAQAAAAIDWKSRNPEGHIVIFGYSRGGVSAVAMSNALGGKKVAVNKLVLFDPVAAQKSSLTLQGANVIHALDFYQLNPRTKLDFHDNPFNGGPLYGANVTNVNLTGVRDAHNDLITHNSIIDYTTQTQTTRSMIDADQ